MAVLRHCTDLSIACLVLAALTGCARHQQTTVVVATTTSVAHSGLLDDLAPAFARETGIQIRAHLVGSGRALRMLETGHAHLVISHAPELEAGYLSRHADWRYRKIMYNHFLIAGPPADPAGVRGAGSAVDAMRRIAQRDVKFVSRGDNSGTHERERQLWRLAGASPGGDRLVSAGQGMSGALRIASEVGAYTLVDRATFAQLEPAVPNLRVLFDSDVRLLNTYAVVTTGTPPPPADRLATWLIAGSGRTRIERYRVHQNAVFSVWPEKAHRTRPFDEPR